MNSQNFILFVKNNKKLISLSLVLSMMLLIAYLFTTYRVGYISTVNLFIKNVYNDGVVTAFGNERSLDSESGYSNPLFNYQEIIRSELVAKYCYDQISKRYKKELNLLGISNQRQWFATFGKMVDTKVIPSTDIIQLSFRWVNKNQAPDVTKLVLNSLRKTNLEILRGVTLQQREFLDSQLETISQELLDVRTQIKNFKLNSKAIDLNDETSELVRKRVELQQQLSSLHSSISYNEQKARELTNILNVKDAKDAMLSNSIGSDPYLQNLNQQLAELQNEYQGMSAKFTDAYPPMQVIKNKIRTVTQNIEAHQKEVLGNYVISKGIYNKASSDIVTDLARVQADAISLKAQYAALQQGIELLKKQESSIPAKKLELDELEKKELALATAYDSIKKKQMEARIHENAIVDNIIVLKGPSQGKPDLKDLVLVCFGFMTSGLLAGMSIAWIKESIHDEWANVEEVERKTGKPVLGALPWKMKGSPAGTPAFYRSNSDMLRTFDNIAHNLVNRSYLENSKVISFCTLYPGRQGSPLISQLAISLANAGHKVLLLDTDMQVPLRHLDYFNCKTLCPVKGLDSLIPEVNKKLRLADADDMPEQELRKIIGEAILHIQTPDNELGELDYLSSAQPQIRAYDFLASPGFKTLVNYLKLEYDFVLMDTPALPIHFPEMDAIVALSEGVVLLSPLAAKRATLIRQVRRLHAKGGNGLGILMRSKQTA
jgi:uncharacterized protein involved in exopolysaccharide biosynthesis